MLASGNGSNLQAIMDACASGELEDVRVAVVLVNRKDAGALGRALQRGIPAIYHPLKPYVVEGRNRREYDADLATLLAPYCPDLVVLAGWMHILSMAFLGRYERRVINIHPALPGTFPGMHAIQRAYEAYQRGEIRHTGIMVHYAPDEGVDEGPVVSQVEVPILPEDTLETLEARMHAAEHCIYPAAIRDVLKSLPEL